MDKIVVTRHAALVEYLIKEGYIDRDTKHVSHATERDIEGMHAYGILPNWLACKAAKFTEVQLRVPFEKRGHELTIEEVAFYIVEPRTYLIKEVTK